MTISPDISIQITFLILLALAVLFTILIIYTAFHRFILNNRRLKFKKSEEYILPYVYQYLDGEITREDFAGVMRNRIDVMIAFKNLNIMIDNLRGEEQTRLRSLLELSQFRLYFLKKLHSRSPIDLAEACMYFEKKDLTDVEVMLQLVFLQEHSYSVLVYAATLALVNVPDQAIRDEALFKFLKNTRNASMAISDIIFKYCSIKDGKQAAADYLGEIVAQGEISPKTAAFIIRMFPTLGYYQLSDTLFGMLKDPPEHDSTGILLATLIAVLDQFAVMETGTELLKQKLWKSEFQTVRLETARWMYNNYSGEWDYILLLLGCDKDLEVRIIAQKALTKSSVMAHIESFIPQKFMQEWKELKKSGDAYAGTD